LRFVLLERALLN